MSDLDEGLLVGRGKKQAKEYKRRMEEVELKLKTLKNKNNELQKQCDGDLESDIRRAIRSQREFLQKEINEIKNMLTKLTQDFTDPTSKNKIKDLCKLAGTEIQRNRRIMQQFVNRASTNQSYMRKSTFGKKKSNSKYESQYSSSSNIQKNITQKLEEEEDISDQLLLEEKITAQRQAILKEIQEKNRIINMLYNDMAEMVGGQQREMVNQIDTNVTVARENVVQANKELDQAIIEQKKAKKKYICIVITVVILILASVGLLLIIL